MDGQAKDSASTAAENPPRNPETSKRIYTVLPISLPICGNTRIEKAIMANLVAASRLFSHSPRIHQNHGIG
jgi:hypothetical protein